MNAGSRTGFGMVNPYAAMWRPPPNHPELTSDKSTVSVARQETVRFATTVGDRYRKHDYGFVAGIGGMAPGITHNGVHVRLNPDAWTLFSVNATNTSGFAATWGVLNRKGVATTFVTLPPLPTAARGIEVWHTTLVLDGQSRIVQATPPAGFRLTN
jgi:hypothetical protein